MNDTDRLRFMHSLFVFNDSSAMLNSKYYFTPDKNMEVGLPYLGPNRNMDDLEPLVEILAYALMPNHYHLLVKQRVENGISEFMQKLGTGYTNAFNLKYKRVGSLFQGKYKFAHINNQRHLLYLPFYIHLNPLDLSIPGWQDNKSKNLEEAWDFLESYKWSSHLDYTGVSNTPHIINKDFLDTLFDGPAGYTKGIKQWMQEYDSNELDQITLE